MGAGFRHAGWAFDGAEGLLHRWIRVWQRNYVKQMTNRVVLLDQPSRGGS